MRFGFGRRNADPSPVVSPTGTYTDVELPPRPGGYDELSWRVTPRTDPSPDGYFWSHQFGFEGGDQGYCGIQTHNAELGGKIAIFSVWSALAARGPGWAAPFGGEGTGFSCRVRFEWHVDRTYELTVRRDPLGTSGGWWEAEVADLGAGTAASIGAIAVAPDWGGIGWRSVMWSERYSGPMRRCSDLRHSAVDFTGVTAQGGTARALGYRNHLADPPTCPNSRITPLPDGARHEMGVDTLSPDGPSPR